MTRTRDTEGQKDFPIIFSAPMVQGLLREARAAGTGKRQTRRLATSPLAKVRPGDRLWVRESLRAASNDQGVRWYSYVADSADVWPMSLWAKDRDNIPSIHMPRWASRITLPTSCVRFQPLQDISEEDAIAEGVSFFVESLDRPGAWNGLDAPDREALVRSHYRSHRDAFSHLWDRLHGSKPGERWEDNPAIVALTFRPVLANVDALEMSHA